MRAHLAVIEPPVFDSVSRIVQGEEPVLIEAFVSEPCHGSSRCSRSPGTARGEEVQRQLVFVGPLVQRPGSELSAVVNHHSLWQAAPRLLQTPSGSQQSALPCSGSSSSVLLTKAIPGQLSANSRYHWTESRDAAQVQSGTCTAPLSALCLAITVSKPRDMPKRCCCSKHGPPVSDR